MSEETNLIKQGIFRAVAHKYKQFWVWLYRAQYYLWARTIRYRKIARFAVWFAVLVLVDLNSRDSGIAFRTDGPGLVAEVFPTSCEIDAPRSCD